MATNDGKSKSFMSSVGDAFRNLFGSKQKKGNVKYRNKSDLSRTSGDKRKVRTENEYLDDDFQKKDSNYASYGKDFSTRQRHYSSIMEESFKAVVKKGNAPEQFDYVKVDMDESIKAMIEKDDSRQNWDKDAVLYLMKTCTSKVLFVGKYHSGKTSIARSLVGNQMYTTTINDRTIVMSFKIWKIAENVTATIYDLGGHPTYEHTVHFFYSDDDNNIVVVTHKLSSEDYGACGKWLKSAVRSSPSATILFALTKCDLTDTFELQTCEKNFFDYMKKEIIKEIRGLEISVHMNSKQDTKDRLQKVLNAYRKLLKDLKVSIYTISCTQDPQDVNDHYPFSGNKFDEFKEKLVSLSRAKSKDIPTLYHNVYTEIGKLGVTENDYTKPVFEDSMKDNESSIKPDESNSDDIDDDIETYAQHNRLQYQTFDTVSEIYKSAYSDLYGKDIEEDSNIKAQVSTCLEFLHSLGLVIWYGDDKNTSNIIFNDVASLTDMLSAIFRHDLKEKLTFDHLNVKAKVQYKNKSQHFTQDVLKLTEKGIMTQRLLYSLLCPFNFEEHLDQVVVLLEKIGICHRNKEKKVEIFLPWFCEDLKMPEKLENIFDWILQPTKTAAAKCFSFTGSIPIEMFYYLCIKLYKQYESTDHTQEREIWHNGFWAWLGEMALLIIYEEGKGIHVIAKSSVSTVESTQCLWKEIRFIHNQLERLSKEWWVSAIGNKTIICDHCLLFLPNVVPTCQKMLKDIALGGNTNAVTLSFGLEFQTWDLENILELTSDGVKSCNCKKQGGILPASLLHPLPADLEQASEEHQELLHFLEQNAPEETNKQWLFPKSGMTSKTLVSSEEIENLKAKVECLTERAEQQDAPLNKDKIKHLMLTDNYDALVEGMVPDDLLRMLISRGIISIEAFQDMENDITPNKVRKIIYCVDQCGEEGIKELISSLERSNQGHLATLLQKH